VSYYNKIFVCRVDARCIRVRMIRSDSISLLPIVVVGANRLRRGMCVRCAARHPYAGTRQPIAIAFAFPVARGFSLMQWGKLRMRFGYSTAENIRRRQRKLHPVTIVEARWFYNAGRELSIEAENILSLKLFVERKQWQTNRRSKTLGMMENA